MGIDLRWIYNNLICHLNMADTLWTIILFVIGLVISAAIIYIVTKLFGEKEGIKMP
jgi:hypothetical protein